MARTDPSDRPGLTLIGKLAVFLIIAGSLYGAYHLFLHGQSGGSSPGAPVGGPTSAPPPPHGSSPTVEIGIAYGTEKKRWLEPAVADFARTPQGAHIKINLIPKGSLEGAQTALRGDDEGKQIHVWSPASSLYKDVFVQDWQIKYGNNPILQEEALALTPMVFVFWDERYQAFASKYETASFQTIGEALQEKGGWDAIAHKPEWGLFKFGHTHPNKSNSGLMTLVLMACAFHGKSKGLTLQDIVNVEFQNWMEGVERGVTGLSDSTGTMMREMVLKGPSSFDVLFVYENVVIDYLKNAEGRWGSLHVEYPRLNAWNDNPYYILDAPWSSPAQRRAAEQFLQYLLSDPVQRQSLAHGFRPGNPDVPVKGPDSPFVQYQSYGLKVDLTTICEPPKAEVINNLLIGWQRTQGTR